ncbi:hypothetical protein KKF91_13980 [Myxococcota bacterium]|nr:hypothetical protein [Myxococcota bacterium]MBU1431648.1 hypothetical protein [Myxococcota bacterium]MBU1900356.1 hypothetical protein [Myxococcota bacterium]
MRITLLLLPLLLSAGGCKSISEGRASPGTVGAECANAEACTQVIEAVCLKMTGGYCSAECAGGAFECDDQSICEPLGDQAYYCLDGCLTENGDGDCRGEYRCRARPEIVNADGREVGVCLPACQRDADCEAGRRCDQASGDCVAKGEKATGAACSKNSSCNGGLCLTGGDFLGGYCSAQCANQFDGCEPGSLCAPIGGAAVCLDACAGDGDCRAAEGYRCRTIGVVKDQTGADVPQRVCAPNCQSNASCEEGWRCDAQAGVCVEGVGAPNPLGGFCESDAECASGRCLTGARWPHGYCSSDCAACEGVCGPDGVCLSACAHAQDCRLGYACVDGGCLGPCAADADCAEGLRCERATGLCVQPSTSDSQVELIPLRALSVGGELSDTVVVDIPEGTQGFAILAEGSGADLMIIGHMEGPSGETLYDFQDPFNSALRFFPGEDFITQMVPSSPRSAVTPGAYSFEMIKDGPTKAIELSLLLKTGDGAPTQGTLDVNFFFADLGGLDAASAPNDRDLQAAIQVMREAYARQNISLAEISYCDLSGADARTFSVVDSVEGPGSELGRMFALSGDAARLGCRGERALNFFLVDEIVGGRAGYIILGIAGGIPGPPGISGTTHSGVAVTMTGLRDNPRQVGMTMAHEGGHFLGLFHTTEAEGTAFDPLNDTPECRNSRDRNGDGVVDDGECRGHGAENLMFWAASDAAEDVSGEQGFVLTRNPAVQ